MLRQLLPLLVIVYVLSFLDRTNIALAKHSMALHLGLSAAAPGLGAGFVELGGVLGWQGWQGLFVSEGLPAVLLAFVVWKVLPNGPASARWLSKEQAEGLERRLNTERDSRASGGRGSHSLRSVIG